MYEIKPFLTAYYMFIVISLESNRVLIAQTCSAVCILPFPVSKSSIAT
jgi:hypothetical protein